MCLSVYLSLALHGIKFSHKRRVTRHRGVTHNNMYKALTCLMATESARTVNGVPLALITSRIASVSDKTKLSFLTPSVCSAYSSHITKKKKTWISFLIMVWAWQAVRLVEKKNRRIKEPFSANSRRSTRKVYDSSCPIKNKHEYFDICDVNLTQSRSTP